MEEREGAFLDAIVELVETDFSFSCRPHNGIQRRMDTMYNYCHDKFSEYLAFQAIHFGSMRGMNTENTLKLFENKFWLFRQVSG